MVIKIIRQKRAQRDSGIFIAKCSAIFWPCNDEMILYLCFSQMDKVLLEMDAFVLYLLFSDMYLISIVCF